MRLQGEHTIDLPCVYLHIRAYTPPHPPTQTATPLCIAIPTWLVCQLLLHADDVGALLRIPATPPAYTLACLDSLHLTTPSHPRVHAMQSLGISKTAAQKVLDRNAAARGGKASFMPQGDLKQMLAEKASLPVQFPKLIHRFPLMQNTPAVSVQLMWPRVASKT